MQKGFWFDLSKCFSGGYGVLLGAVSAFLLLFFSIQPMGKSGSSDSLQLLHVSFDPTREVIFEINEHFANFVKSSQGLSVKVLQSHGGSGSQARSVVDGLAADVVSLALWTDLEVLGRKNLLKPGWDSSRGVVAPPWKTVIVFVVRKGNPKGIRDWGDLVGPNIELITPNPKISGNGRLVFLSAWGYSLQRQPDIQAARDFLAKLYHNVPVMDASARASQVTFFQKRIGDVQLAFESEALMAVKESAGQLEIVYPSTSIQVDPPLVLVDKNVDAKGTRGMAESYLSYFFSPDAQRIIAKNGYRPTNPEILQEFESKFPPIQLFGISLIGKGWAEVQSAFFGEGGEFDQIFRNSRRDGK